MLGRLHHQELVHNNFLASHVVGRSGNYRLISLRRMPKHICYWRGDNPNWDANKANWWSSKISCQMLESERNMVMSGLTHESESDLQK